MKLESVRILRGANVWGSVKVLEAQLALESLVPVVDAQTLAAAAAASPVLAAREAFLAFDVRKPAWPALLGLLTWVLQPRVAGSAPRVEARAIPVSRDSRISRIVVPYFEEEVATRALDLAFRWIRSISRGIPAPDVQAEYQQLCNLEYQSIRLGPSTLGIVQAAERRGIPVRRLTDGSLVQLGFGVRQRRIWAAETDATSLVAESIAQDKELTKHLLEAADSGPQGVSGSVSC